jgi:hypothetical protein
MERTIVLEATDDKFSIDIKSADRASRNRYFSNATDCCGVEESGKVLGRVQEKKICSHCGKDVVKTSRKIVKIGKTEKLIDAGLLNDVLEQLEAVEEIHITQIADEVPVEVERRYERLMYGDVVKKKEEDYATLRAYMGDSTGFGYGVFGHNKYAVTLKFEGPVLFIRKLVDETQMVEIDSERIAMETTKKVDPELVELGRQAVDAAKVKEVDITQYKDDRIQMEQELIEQLVDGKLPEFVPKVTEKLVEDKKEKLKKLLAAKTSV